jgi:scyllo-inositol 2-dehydrogenase (NAD+)
MPNRSGRLSAALVGCGRMGAWTSERVRHTAPAGWMPLSHAEAIQTIDGISLDAVCDLDFDLAQRTGKEYGIDAVYCDAESMIDEVHPDILAIATRTPGRCDLIVHAANAGVRGIHAEKPVGWNLAEIRNAMTVVEEKGVAFTYGATRRFMPMFRHARNLVESGLIGEPEQITIDMGRTLLMWNHPHSTDLLLYFASSGEAETVQAAMDFSGERPNNNQLDEDPIVKTGIVTFSNGIIGLITSARGMNVHLDGSDGRLSIEGDATHLIHASRKEEGNPYFLRRQQITVEEGASGTVAAFRALHDSIISGIPVADIRPSDIVDSHRLLFGMALSALQGGCRIPLEDVTDEFTVTGKFHGKHA